MNEELLERQERKRIKKEVLIIVILFCVVLVLLFRLVCFVLNLIQGAQYGREGNMEGLGGGDLSWGT